MTYVEAKKNTKNPIKEKVQYSGIWSKGVS